MVPASPPFVSEKMLPNSIPIHVDIVVIANPKTDRDLKFRRSSCDRPIRAMSKASVVVPVVVPVASTRARWSAELVVSVKPLLACISKVAMTGWRKEKSAVVLLQRTQIRLVLDSRVGKRSDSNNAEQ
jgi:hypothetical protein